MKKHKGFLYFFHMTAQSHVKFLFFTPLKPQLLFISKKTLPFILYTVTTVTVTITVCIVKIVGWYLQNTKVMQNCVLHQSSSATTPAKMQNICLMRMVRGF